MAAVHIHYRDVQVGDQWPAVVTEKKQVRKTVVEVGKYPSTQGKRYVLFDDGTKWINHHAKLIWMERELQQ